MVNDGSIAGSIVGVDLGSGGSVTNAASASSSRRGVGVVISGGAGTVVNDGSIAGSGIGVVLSSGGSVTNGSVRSYHGSADHLRRRHCGQRRQHRGRRLRRQLSSGGSVTNGRVRVDHRGNIGVDLSGGTLTNAGSIIGSSGTAVAFGGTGSNLLVLDAGFGFSGIVAGGTSSSNSLELASGSSMGTVTGLGSEFVRFRLDRIRSRRAMVRLRHPAWPRRPDQWIRCQRHDRTHWRHRHRIELRQRRADARSRGRRHGHARSAWHLHLRQRLRVTNVAAGADVTVACFLAGTRILTAYGEIAVEDLVIGEHVITHSGEAKPIKWIGVGKVLATRGQRTAATAGHRAKGALADNVPHRDLRVTKGHSLYIDGVLIPVEELINHRSILLG